MTSRTAYQQELTMNIADDTVPIKITASRRKSMSLKLNPKGVVDVRIPVGISKFQVLAFLGSHEDWLIKRYKQFKAIQQQRSQAVMIGGVEHTILKSMVKDRKSTRLNSSHVRISYAVFCLKKKK